MGRIRIMFTFFKRSNKIYLDCFTTKKYVIDYTPIVKANHSIPDWWKKLDNINIKKINGNLQYVTNMKKCYGFIELFKRGCSIEYWTDCMFEVSKEKYTYNVLETNSIFNNIPCEEHSKDHYLNGFNNYHHVKLLSPWIFKTKCSTPFLFMGNEWNNELPFKIMPGIINYDLINGTHINLFLPKQENTYTFNISIGTPLVHIIPLQDDKELIINNHLISESEYKKICNTGSISYNGIYNLKRLLKRNKERTGKGCPFGFK